MAQAFLKLMTQIFLAYDDFSMKKAFVSVSFNKKNELESEITTIVGVLKKHNINPFVFVNTYIFSLDKEKEMMDKATKAIATSDILIAEVTDKPIGVGIEIGYAYALRKKIICLRKKRAEYSTTVGGIADEQIIYSSNDELKTNLEKALSRLRF